MDSSIFNKGWENTSDKDKLITLQNLENQLAVEEGRTIKCEVVSTRYPKI